MADSPAVPIFSGAADFLKWLINGSANNASASAMNQGFDRAANTIGQAHTQAMGFLKPFLEGGAQDYGQYRNMVNSGYFQTPFSKSFTSQSYSPQGFSFNPQMGSASFSPFQPQGGPATFTPPSLPPRPAMPSMTPGPVTMGGGQPGTIGPMTPEQLVAKSKQMTMPVVPPTAQIPPQAGAGPLANWNQQTGQGNPLVEMGVKPADPRMPSQFDLMRLLMQNPWMRGGSGPLEGGMGRTF